MSNCLYEVQMEVEGPLAMFARPDTGGTPTSYPLPTWSAAKGLFEAIAFFKDGAGWVRPTKVQICRRVGEKGGAIRFQRYTTNYGGPLRKSNLLKNGSSMQLYATVLSDACYRIFGEVVGQRVRNGLNPRHHLQAMIQRRLRRGQCYRTPCLGWSEFTCTYWGPFREGMTERDDSLSLTVPSMMFGVWDHPISGEYAPAFCQDVHLNQGELIYHLPQEHPWGVSEEFRTDA